jgi:HAD superfamily hydrolase (TIGR01509 family)
VYIGFHVAQLEGSLLGGCASGEQAEAKKLYMMIQGICIDFGGVIVQPRDLSLHRRWEERLGLAPGQLAAEVWNTPPALQALRGEIAEAELWRAIARRHGLSEPDADQLAHDFFAPDEVDADLVAFLVALRPRHRTAILSNAWASARTVFCARYGLDRVVDEIIISAEEGVTKSHAAIYQRTAERLGLPLDALVLLDDSPENVAGAEAAGMRAILFRSTTQAILDLRDAVSTDHD